MRFAEGMHWLFPCWLVCLVTAALAEETWPQFRGPGGLAQGSGDPPVEFGPSQAVLWKTPVPAGHSSPCIWCQNMALTGWDGERLITFCLDRQTGRERWRAVAPAEKTEPTHRISSPAAPTCCTDGERVFAYFGSYGVLAYDWEGKEIWRKPLPLPVVEFGTSASPIVREGLVVIVADQDIGSYMVALDAATGAERWRVERPEFRRSFSTPVIWEHDGELELVVVGSLWVRGYELRTGKERWSARGVARVANASPVVADGLLFVSSWNVGGDEDDRIALDPFATFAAAHDSNGDGKITLDEFPEGPVKGRFSQMDADKDGFATEQEYEQMRSMFAEAANQLFAIRPGGRGDITETHVVWQVSKHLPYVSSPIFANGRIFTMKSGGLASAYEARSGSPIYQAERVEASGDYYSSAVTAADRVYVTSQRGTVVVLDATSDTLKVLARNDLREAVFASPAILDGVLYLRTEKHLFAFRE